jgi:hypothetical protein
LYWLKERAIVEVETVTKRRTPSKHAAAGVTHRNGSTIPARPASELKLTKAEIALLEDPDWVTEDEADVIHCKRAEASQEVIPLEKVLSEIGERNRRKLVGSKVTFRRSG